MKDLIRLFEFELKRNIKNYIFIIICCCSFVILNIVKNLNDYNYIIENAVKSEQLTKIGNMIETVNVTGFSSFRNIMGSTESWFMFGIIACICYAFFIWYRDFNGRSKSIYTLIMLPKNRINIYISKLLNILFLVYSYTVVLTISLFIASKLLPRHMLGNVTNYGFVQETIYELKMLLPYSFEILFVEYIFLLIGFVSVVFTSILINKSIYKVSTLISFLFLVIEILVFIISIEFIIPYEYSDVFTVLYSSINIFVCSLISNKLLKQKIDF
ncbi:hypothetical protein NQ894_17320 [Clostridioides difficile]|nr:hypothetical protein [Clostridioides difficile]